MTRLVEADVCALIERLPEVDAGLRSVTGVDLREVALLACDLGGSPSPLIGVRMAAVPVSSGFGFIPYFSQCVATILNYLGGDAFVTAQADVRGLQEAVSRGAEAVFMADDDRFVALDLRGGVCADNDPCTANSYVAALEAAAGGLSGRRVLVMGLGPVGRAAARRLRERGVEVLGVEPDEARAAAAARDYGVAPVSLRAGLSATELVFDATPVADIVDYDWVTPRSIAAAPGLPSGFTTAAQAALGARHIHEPLALSVAAMAVEALSGHVSARA